MTDRTTKMLLLAIALGLWCNVAVQWLAPVHAQSPVDSPSQRSGTGSAR
jgi:hypothetical protein